MFGMFSGLKSRIHLMAHQRRMAEDSATKLDPPVGQDPRRESTSHSSSETQVYERESLLRQGDQVGTQGQGFQESLQPENQSRCTANEEGNTEILGLPFARKLWTMAQNEAFQSVNWSHDGDSIIIEVEGFQREVLQRRGAGKIFETDSLKSFIHQLNLYGFRKVYAEDSALKSGDKRKMLIYRNFNFRRDKPELLENIGRKKWRNMARAREAQSPLTSASEQGPSPKKVKLLPTRRSPRLHKTEEDDVMSQQEVPNNKTPADKVSSLPSSALEKSQHPCNTPYNSPPQETNSPCGEGTSDKDTVSPLATVKVEGFEHVPSSSSGYLGCGYMRSVYNTCSSILKAAITAVSISVSAEEEYGQEQKEVGEGEEEERNEEDEEYSENTCIICALLNKMKRS